MHYKAQILFNTFVHISTELHSPPHLTYLLTYLLTPWSRVILEKLTGSAASQEILRILSNDRRLNWKYHITQTRNHLNHKTRGLYWILGKHSPLSLRNKILLYKVILRPVWTYGIELWGCASTSNIEILQRYQSKLLRLITQAPWYVANHILHNDLGVPKVREIFQARTATHYTTLVGHSNPLMRPLTLPPPPRRLKRTWTFDALN